MSLKSEMCLVRGSEGELIEAEAQRQDTSGDWVTPPHMERVES